MACYDAVEEMLEKDLVMAAARLMKWLLMDESGSAPLVQPEHSCSR
jgi:hypothetical protein